MHQNRSRDAATQRTSIRKEKLFCTKNFVVMCKTASFACFYQQDIKLIKVHSVEPPGESLIAFRVQRSAGMSTNDLLRKIGLLCPRILQNLFAFSFFMTVGQQCSIKMENNSSTLSCCQWPLDISSKGDVRKGFRQLLLILRYPIFMERLLNSLHQGFLIL